MIRPKQVSIWAAFFVTLCLGRTAQAATLTASWSANPEADIAGYLLSYGTESGLYPNTVDVGNQTSYQVNGLADSTTYFFVVQAYNTSGEMSVPSDEVSATTSGDDAPSALFLGTDTATQGNWPGVYGSDGYVLA